MIFSKNEPDIIRQWPKGYICWIKSRTLYVSIPFTWELPKVSHKLAQLDFQWDKAIVGGPAVYLMPDYFDHLPHVLVGYEYPGILQKMNPNATRTTLGCIRKCGFCGVPTFEGNFRELSDWPDRPVLCDNNLLAASIGHFDKVIDRLKQHNNVDFNQGLDSRLLTDHHAKRIAEINGLKFGGVRLSLDHFDHKNAWINAYKLLRSAGIAKKKISSYALIGYNSGPTESWSRCRWIEDKGVKAMPMWFHGLNQLVKNTISKDQFSLGWNDFERRKIMQWFYKHKRAVKRKVPGNVYVI